MNEKIYLFPFSCVNVKDFIRFPRMKFSLEYFNFNKKNPFYYTFIITKNAKA